jgi:nucleoside-diphosphate-sugar epimerase
VTTLVTGGTGTLGRPTVARLRARGDDVRVLSRRPGHGHLVGDLRTGAGLAAALDGADTVIDCATTRWRDLAQTERLLDAAQSGTCCSSPSSASTTCRTATTATRSRATRRRATRC